MKRCSLHALSIPNVQVYRPYLCSVKHLVLVILVAILAASAVAQPINQTDAKGRKQGPWKKTFENGALRYEGQFKDNLPVGDFKHYNNKGQLEAINTHAGDGKRAVAKLYHPNGKLKGTGLYINTKKDSVWRYFNEEGLLVLEEGYTFDVLNGVQRSYFPNTGKLVEEITFKDGKKNGPWQRWFDNGKLWSKGAYVNDELEGEYEMNYPDGKAKLRGLYKQGMRMGVWIDFNENASIRSQTVYKEGRATTVKRENGTFDETYPSGIPKATYNYAKGQLHGDFTEWYDKGKFELKQRNNKETGNPETYEDLVGTVMKRKGEYMLGQLNGEVIYFNEDGKRDKVELYDNGKLLKTQ